MNDEIAAELIGAINRLSTAVEQAVLAALDDRTHFPDEPVPLPPMNAPVVPQMSDVCPIHKLPWRVVPAGVSKRTGQTYDAFRACPTAGCTQRPART